MLGDDPDPTVTIVRFGFGEVSDTHMRGRRKVDNDKGHVTRSTEASEERQLRTMQAL